VLRTIDEDVLLFSLRTLGSIQHDGRQEAGILDNKSPEFATKKNKKV